MREWISIQLIADITGGKVIGNDAMKLAFFATDSRALPRSEGVMFAAIPGKHHNGHDFLDEVYEQGIRCFLVEQKPEIILDGAAYCIVSDSLESLQKIAAYRRSRFRGNVVAVTGSNGKTIVKEWLYQALQESIPVVRSPRSYNSQLGVPLSVWQLTANYETGIIEAGISEPGEMERLERIILPNIGILTNIGTAHSENFPSDSAKLEEKLKLFMHSDKIIYNSDLEVDGRNIRNFLDAYQAERIEWSFGDEATYSVSVRPEDGGGSIITIAFEKNSIDFPFPFSDRASIEDGIHVIICLLELGLDIDSIQKATRELESVEMRLETLAGIYGSTLLSDVYNADLAGLGAALDLLEQQQKHEKKLVILSEVYQSGLDAPELYTEVAELLRFRNIDTLFFIGESISEQRDVFPESARFYNSTEDFLQCFDPLEISGAAVLIKGARKFSFEAITHRLQHQYHHTVLEINVNDLISNLNQYRSLLDTNTKLMLMVKALSYGTGGAEIAGYLQHEKVDYLAVAYVDEGIALR